MGQEIMRASHLFIKTYKETPREAEVISHQLMLRAGLIRQLAAGVYTWLPLGLRVLRNIEQIVREEMNNIGAQELLMPAIQPAELWQESGRWQAYGPELLRLKDRHDREFCFGPTHEEVITDLVRKEIRGHKQLPLTFYQIQTKFRDEVRPRFGIMRGREFLMKDAYSFHVTPDSLNKTYEDMYKAYHQIFTRLGLEFRAVLADTGSIGGDASHEFHVLANSGEDTIFYSNESNYCANIELAEAVPEITVRPDATHPLEKVSTPSQKTIEEVCNYLKCKPQETLKTLIVRGKEGLVAIALRGDHNLNLIKAAKHPLIGENFVFAKEDEIIKVTNCAPGAVGPIGLSIPIIADRSAYYLADFICGANENDFHYRYANWGRDCPEPEIADLRNVVEGDVSPDGKGRLKQCKGIEVGHIFKLGTKYSSALKAQVLDEKGESQVLWMGCYGIGVSRLVAAAIEQNYDDKGIIWPNSIAPFHISLVPINLQKSKRVELAVNALYQQLREAGYRVLLEDRNERTGVIFADLDLIGIPHRLVLSERSLDAGTIEYKGRREDTVQNVPLDEIMRVLKERIQK